MFGAMFKLGELKSRPGVYVRLYNADGTPRFSRPLGVAAQVIKSNWGPLKTVIQLDGKSDIKSLIGTGKGAETVAQLFKGGASYVHVVRVGSEGQKATATLETSDAKSLTLTTKYPTSRNFLVTVRDSLDASKKELLLVEDGKLIENLTFDQGENEVASFREAIKTSNYLDMQSDSEGQITNVPNTAFTAGTDPTVTAEDYTNGMELTETKFFDSIGVDTEDASIHAAVHAFVRRKLQEGYRVTTFLGADPNDDFATKIQLAKSFNDFAVAYVGNGVELSNGRVLVGSLAAARVMGMFISGSYKSSLTKKTIDDAVSIVGELTSKQYDEAAKNGLMVFSLSLEGVPQIDYGINTFTTINDDYDKGWSKLRRVRTRYELIDRIVYQFDRAMRNEVDNEPDGHQFLITLANGEINQMITEKGLASGAMIMDPDFEPEGDSAWFKFDNLVDLDGLEKAYLSFGFRY